MSSEGHLSSLRSKLTGKEKEADRMRREPQKPHCLVESDPKGDTGMPRTESELALLLFDWLGSLSPHQSSCQSRTLEEQILGDGELADAELLEIPYLSNG